MTNANERLKALQENKGARDILIAILTKLAGATKDPDEFYYSGVLQQSNLPPAWVTERAGAKTVSPKIGATQLLNWAIARNVNIHPQYRDYTAVGSILEPLFDMVGWEDARQLAAIIVAYRLYMNPARLQELMEKYKIPAPAAGTGEHADDLRLVLGEAGEAVGPPFQWRGGDEKDLQAFWKQPDYFDVGFLMRATEAARAVCRIVLPTKERFGTGFLIEPGLLLTNYHVLKDEEDPDDDIAANVAEAELYFGYVTAADGKEVEVRPFKLAGEGPLAFSEAGALDFALLKVEDGVKYENSIRPLPNRPLPGGIKAGDKSLNVVQHPGGETMKVALSSNGVTSVEEQDGLIQYVSKTAGGSSGSPCFNNEWKLVALHHAEVPTLFGSRREGILYSRVFEKIKGLL